MSLAARLIHRLILVEPGEGDPEDIDDLDAYGHAEAGPETETPVFGLVQPRSTNEMVLTSQAGSELSSHVIYLLPRNIASGAYLVDADVDSPTVRRTGGRRFDIEGVRSFEFGRSPHLEVDCNLVGSSEGPGVGS